MPRTPRWRIHAEFYHVINRGHMRQRLFTQFTDYRKFLTLLRTAPNAKDIDLLAYCLMPNHWHLVIRPRVRDALSAYVQWVTGTHAARWNRDRGRVGLGPVYQGRFRSFPIARERHLLSVLRYVEANAVRAGLVEHAAGWPWSSSANHQDIEAPVLASWPMPRPGNWHALLDEALEAAEMERIREATRSGLDLDTPVRSRGRPRKKGDRPHFGGVL